MDYIFNDNYLLRLREKDLDFAGCRGFDTQSSE
jgi:hypothetical protein